MPKGKDQLPISLRRDPLQLLYKWSITKSTSQEKHIISTSKSFSFAEEIGNQFNSTLSLFGILLLCRDDIAYLSEDPPVAASATQITLPRYYNNHQKVIIYFIVPQLIAMELLLNSLNVAMARS